MAPPRPRSDRRTPAHLPPARKRRAPRWPFVLAPLLVLGVVFAFSSGLVATGPQPVASTATIVPEHTVHEFGSVKIHGGLLAASFPLTVDGPVNAIDLTTS